MSGPENDKENRQFRWVRSSHGAYVKEPIAELSTPTTSRRGLPVNRVPLSDLLNNASTASSPEFNPGFNQPAASSSASSSDTSDTLPFDDRTGDQQPVIQSGHPAVRYRCPISPCSLLFCFYLFQLSNCFQIAMTITISFIFILGWMWPQ